MPDSVTTITIPGVGTTELTVASPAGAAAVAAASLKGDTGATGATGAQGPAWSPDDAIYLHNSTTTAINAAIDLVDDEVDANGTIFAPASTDGFTFQRQEREIVLSGRVNLSGPIYQGLNTRLRFNGVVLNGSALSAGQYAIDYKPGHTNGHRCSIVGSGLIRNAPNGIRWKTGTLGSNLDVGNSVISGVTFAGIPGICLDIHCRSNVVAVERCTFDRVGTILHQRACDDLVLRNCFARPDTTLGSPIKLEWGWLKIEGGVWVPRPNAEVQPELAWVDIIEPEGGATDKEQLLDCLHMRSGGEFGNGGMAVCHLKSAPSTGTPPAPGSIITIRDCFAVAGQANDGEDPPTAWPPAIVWLTKLPKSLTIDGGWVNTASTADIRRFVQWSLAVNEAAQDAMLALVTAYDNDSGVNARMYLRVGHGGTVQTAQRVPVNLASFLVE